MTLVANEKPNESWADLICQDRVVAHPENLIWVFRRSHVRDNPLRWIDPLGLWEVPPPPPGGTGCYQNCVKAAKDAEDDCEKKLGLLKAIFPASAEWV
jgi:hypothetical protein